MTPGEYNWPKTVANFVGGTIEEWSKHLNELVQLGHGSVPVVDSHGDFAEPDLLDFPDDFIIDTETVDALPYTGLMFVVYTSADFVQPVDQVDAVKRAPKKMAPDPTR